MYDTPPKFNMLTWNLKMMVSKKNLLFQGVDFQVPCAQLQVCIFTYIYHTNRPNDDSPQKKNLASCQEAQASKFH